MTRKDYILIAAAFAEAKRQIPNTGLMNQTYENIGLATAARVVAWSLAKDNQRFDRERFLNACGVQP
jgi:hypothetical protein